MNHNEFVIKLNSKYHGKYELIGEYKGYEEYHKFKHNECGNIWDTKPHTIMRNIEKGKCPFCEISAKNMTEEQFRYKFSKMEHNEEYELLEFKGYMKGITLRHKKCGYEWKTDGENFRRGRQCPKCMFAIHYTTEQYRDIIKNTDNSYTLISEYIDEKTKIRLRHDDCGYEWNILPRNFVYNNCRCPICKQIKSKKVEYIKKYLDNKNIKYELEKRFSECKHSRELPFDFYIESQNILIEFDGEQHFFPMRFSDSVYDFEDTILRDSIKNSYCLTHGIKLLRLHYKLKDNEISIILDELINNNYNLSSTTIENYKLYYSSNSYMYYSMINPEYITLMSRVESSDSKQEAPEKGEDIV